jgi:hypothetical protein
MESIKIDKYNSERKNSLVFLYSIACYLIVLTVFSVLVHKIYSFDVSSSIKIIKNETIRDLVHFNPEPIEWIIYTSGLISLPFLLLSLYFVIHQYANTLLTSKTAYYVSWSIVFTLPIMILIYASTREWGLWYYETFLENTVFNIVTLLPFISLTLLVTLIYFNKLNFFKVYKTTILRNVSTFLNIVVLYFISLLFFANVFDVSASEWGWSHFDAIYYSVVQVYNSSSALYIDRFYNTYGMYPHILEPIFALLGGVSVIKFTLIQGLLLVTSFVIIHYVMRKLITNKLLVSAGFLSVIWAQYYFERFASMYFHRTMEYYFQYSPLRLIFPCLILLIAYKYTSGRTNTMRFVGYFLSALSLIWNIETGVIVSISWYLFIVYIETYTDSIRMNIFKIIKEFLVFITVIFATLSLYYFYIFVRYGNYIQVQEIFQMVNFFTSLGYYMLKMDLIGPWNILIIIYISAFFYALINIGNKLNYQYNSMMFLLSIMGFGLFYYYLGRSTNTNIFPVSWPGIILLFLYANTLHVKFKKGLGLIHEKLIFISIITLSLGSIITIIYYIPDGFNRLIIERNQILNLHKNSIVKSNIDFIKTHTEPFEKVLILSGRQGVYHSETKTASLFNTGLTDLFKKKDYDRLTNLILSKGNKIFLDKDTFNSNNPVYSYNNGFIVSVVKSRYKLVDLNQNMLYFSMPE